MRYLQKYCLMASISSYWIRNTILATVDLIYKHIHENIYILPVGIHILIKFTITLVICLRNYDMVKQAK